MLIAVLLLAALQAEGPRERAPLPSDLEVLHPAQGPSGEGGLSLSLRGRFSGLFGDVAGASLGYDDLFDVGFGLSTDVRYSWPDRSPRFGLGASFAYERFDGLRVVDDLGDSYEPEGLEVLSVVVGLSFLAHGSTPEGSGVRFEAFFGGGASWNPSVNATFLFSGNPPVVAEFFRSSVQGFGELALRFGVFGEHFAFTLGLRFRLGEGLEAGSGVTTVIAPDWAFLFTGELGWEYRF
jgi:hypothetical protein